MSFPRYPAYKDSGVEWLGEVPEHWEVTRLGFLCSKIGSGKTPLGGGEAYLAEGILFIRSQNVYDDGLYLDDVVYVSEATDSEQPWSRVFPGDVLLNITGASLGRTCLVPKDFQAANVNQHVCILRLADTALSHFVSMALKSSGMKSQFDAAQNGAAREGLNFAQISKLELAVGSPEEQVSIYTFLDHETAKIDALIAEQQRLIELLQEKRQAVISHAVTKGLNPDVPMKDSGVEWLGEVPEHWEVLELKRLNSLGSSITYGIVQAGPHIDDGVPYIRTSDMSGEILRLETCQRTSWEIDEAYTRSKVQEGDLVIAIRATVGKALVVPTELDGANLTQGTAKFSPSGRVSSAFMKSGFSSSYCQAQIGACAKGATFLEITLDSLRRLAFGVPPIEEQLLITNFLENSCNEFDALLCQASTACILLKERRSALISAAVTGQIDVRGYSPETAVA